MAVQFLPKISAFTSGAETWFLPDSDSCHWTSSLDWYLNFQLAKSEVHRSPHIGAGLQRILTENDIHWGSLPAPENSALLISSSAFLPNRQTILLKFENDLELWLGHILKMSANLKTTTVRIFMPQGAPRDVAQSYLTKHSKGLDFTLIADEAL